MVERRLDLTFLLERDIVKVGVYEPESGEKTQFDIPLSVDEHPEFDATIGAEIYSWLSLWADEDEGEETL